MKHIARAAFLAVAFAVPAIAADAPSSAINAAVAHYARPPYDRARDAARMPAEVLAFAGIKPGQVVADLVPDDGYYTRILSKAVGAKGKVFAFVVANGYPQQERAVEYNLMKKGSVPPRNPIDKALAIQDTRSEYANVTAVWEQLWQMDTGEQFAVPDQVDVVFSANAYGALHDAKITNSQATFRGRPPRNVPLDMVAVNKAIFAAMKPGGVYVISDAGDGAQAKTEATAAGFAPDGESSIVSGHYLLRFKKPANASAETKRPKTDLLAAFYGNTSHNSALKGRARWVSYHKDGTFEEYGNEPTWEQQGTWFWDAAGRNCMLKEFPQNERGSVICHNADFAGRKPGDGSLEAGFTYPAPASAERSQMDSGEFEAPNTKIPGQ